MGRFPLAGGPSSSPSGVAGQAGCRSRFVCKRAGGGARVGRCGRMALAVAASGEADWQRRAPAHMSDIPARLRRLVIRRAGGRCEYCGLSQAGQEATFHIDHIIPTVAGGATTAGNLALACVSCSLRKGARQTASDPQTGEEVPLFHPRRDSWKEHFAWEGVLLLGLSATGRATIAALDMNRAIILAIRREEALLNRHPPL